MTGRVPLTVYRVPKVGSQSEANGQFDFEKLEVYQLSLEFFDQLVTVCRGLPGDLRYPLNDQLIRAALSISNNIAEGSGKQSNREKARYYGTSIDSARECMSMVNVLKRQRVLDEQQYHALRTTGYRVTSMLRRLAESLQPER